MKIRPTFPEMTLEDLVAVITENFRELERLARKGVRGPLGSPGLPAFGFQNTGFDGVGTSALHDKNGNPAGLLTEADVQRFRASSPSKGSVVEAVPNAVPDAGGDPARISAYGTDVQADPENYSSADLMAVAAEMRVLSRKFGTAALRDLVLGLLSDSTFSEAFRIAIVSGALRIGVMTGPTPNIGFDVNTGVALRESTPTPLSTDTHNYAFAGGNPELVIQRLSATGPVSLTGIADGVEGEWHILRNVTAPAISIPNDSASSDPQNRFYTGAGTIALSQNQQVEIFWDHILLRWMAGPAVYTAGGAGTAKESHIVLLATFPEKVCT